MSSEAWEINNRWHGSGSGGGEGHWPCEGSTFCHARRPLHVCLGHFFHAHQGLPSQPLSTTWCRLHTPQYLGHGASHESSAVWVRGDRSITLVCCGKKFVGPQQCFLTLWVSWLSNCWVSHRYGCIHTNGAIVMLMLIVETITDGESTIQQVQTLLAN